ncbi:Hypothetical Protein FCC1311_102122 [Hondaea fermentalgiana]|uniref:Uncharacterized protein n=1 Tax=Hondaea fermentalgiana TaxID=2315210 RepID=A0A2R5GUI8_9STRA|nr:Hypothetical Protein FCC1311_102122 [Hondaea fermentalgiana]|eukprot:GBG33989.1 Hypothetical Protein FCC1311_102122 [Hondaea fermentalgiana]
MLESNAPALDTPVGESAMNPESRRTFEAYAASYAGRLALLKRERDGDDSPLGYGVEHDEQDEEDELIPYWVETDDEIEADASRDEESEHEDARFSISGTDVRYRVEAYEGLLRVLARDITMQDVLGEILSTDQLAEMQHDMFSQVKALRVYATRFFCEFAHMHLGNQRMLCRLNGLTVNGVRLIAVSSKLETTYQNWCRAHNATATYEDTVQFIHGVVATAHQFYKNIETLDKPSALRSSTFTYPKVYSLTELDPANRVVGITLQVSPRPQLASFERNRLGELRDVFSEAAALHDATHKLFDDLVPSLIRDLLEALLLCAASTYAKRLLVMLKCRLFLRSVGLCWVLLAKKITALPKHFQALPKRLAQVSSSPCMEQELLILSKALGTALPILTPANIGPAPEVPQRRQAMRERRRGKMSMEAASVSPEQYRERMNEYDNYVQVRNQLIYRVDEMRLAQAIQGKADTIPHNRTEFRVGGYFLKRKDIKTITEKEFSLEEIRYFCSRFGNSALTDRRIGFLVAAHFYTKEVVEASMGIDMKTLEADMYEILADLQRDEVPKAVEIQQQQLSKLSNDAEDEFDLHGRARTRSTSTNMVRPSSAARSRKPKTVKQKR